MRYAVVSTPLGPLTLASTPRGLASLHFGKNIPQSGIVDVASNREFILEIEQYFLGKRTKFDCPLDFSGTPFQVSVWQELMKIPYGQTRTYGEIAKSLGRPGASRAVGMANHDNRIAIVIPCHRVIGQNGSLTGYAGGIHLKQQLLSLEKNTPLFT
jgi:methylated-DNA-[protein]-cysteine S-methyltransferase